MDNEIKKYLFDIHESINSIDNYLGNIRISKFTVLTKCFAEQLNGNLK